METIERSDENQRRTLKQGKKKIATPTSPSKYNPPAINSGAPPPPLTSTCRNLRISAFTLSPLSALSATISEPAAPSVVVVVTATAASALTDLKSKLRYIACLEDVARRESCSEA